jgi:hypothetical protein
MIQRQETSIIILILQENPNLMILMYMKIIIQAIIIIQVVIIIQATSLIIEE